MTDFKMQLSLGKRPGGLKPGAPFTVFAHATSLQIFGSYTVPTKLGRPVVAVAEGLSEDPIERERTITALLDLLNIRCTTEGEKND